MSAKNTCPKCGTAVDTAAQSRFCLECGADLAVSDAELKAEEERKRKEAEELRRKKNEDEIKRAKEARERREAEERERKRKEAEAAAKAKAAAEEEKRKRKAEKERNRASKAEDLKEKASNALEWVVGALIIFTIAYSLFNGIPLLNGVKLNDLPADMVDWVMWEVEELTGSVPHKEGPIYRVSKETTYSSDGKIVSEHSYDYDRRGNMTRQAHMYYNSDSVDSSGTTIEYSDFDDLGYFHTYHYEGSSPSNVTYEMTGNMVKKREFTSGFYDEYEYYQGEKIKTYTNRIDDTVEQFEYDGNGLVRTRSYGSVGGHNSTKTFVWELDSEGNPKGYKFGYGTESEIASLGDSAVHRIFCDDDGNITTIRDPQGKRELEREYVKILRPSLFAWTKAHAIDLDCTNEE